MGLKKKKTENKQNPCFCLGFSAKRKKSFLRNLIPYVDDSEIQSLETNVKLMEERWNLWEKLSESM